MGYRRWRGCTWLVVAAFFASAWGSGTSFHLSVGPGVERQIRPPESHGCLVDLETGQYLHLVVDQRGIDLEVTVFDTADRRLFAVDSPNGANGDEHVYLVAETAGTYRAEVRPLNDRTPPGRYLARIAALRRASPDDRHRAEAERAFAEAREAEAEHRGALLPTAVEKYLRAEYLFGRLGDARRRADALYRLARMYREAGHPHQAIRYYEQVLEELEGSQATADRAVAWNDLGAAFREVGKPDQARAAFEKALALHQAADFARGKAVTLLQMADFEAQQGRAFEALRLFEEALSILRSVGHLRELVTALNGIGAVYTAMSEVSLALDLHEQARAMLDPKSNPGLWAMTANNIGNAHLEAHQLDKARESYEQALAVFAPGSSARSAAVALAGLGLVHAKTGRYTETFDCYSRSLEIFERRGETSEAAVVLNNLGWLHGRRGEAQEALELHERALVQAQEMGDPALEAAARFGMARAERQRGRLDEAISYMQTALELIEDIRKATLRTDLRLAYLASQQSYYRFLVELYMERHRARPQAGDDALAFGVAERSRARQLLETLGEDREKFLQSIEPQLPTRARKLLQLVFVAEDDLRRERAGKGGDVQALERERRRRLALYRSVEAQIRRASPWYASLHQPVPLALEDVQRALDPETLLIEIQLGAPHSFLWLVGSGFFRSVELTDRTTIEAQARRFREHLLHSDAEVSRQAGAQLAQTLLAEVYAELDRKRLVFVVDGGLYYVPLAALPVPDAGGSLGESLLLDRHEVLSLPSASVLAALRQRRAERTLPDGLVAVVADPVYAADDSRLSVSARAVAKTAVDQKRNLLPQPVRLPNADREAREILALASPEPALDALGFDADRTRIFGGELADYRIVHFATHGVLDTEHPELSTLWLSRFDQQGQPVEGRVRMQEIHRLALTAELVVLSGCETALGRELDGEGLLGLTRAFLYAGTDRVVASLWRVSDPATAELMMHFYRALLQEGRRPPAALRQAQEALRRDPRWKDPYFWAGFVLQGDWR